MAAILNFFIPKFCVQDRYMTSIILFYSDSLAI